MLWQRTTTMLVRPGSLCPLPQITLLRPRPKPLARSLSHAPSSCLHETHHHRLSCLPVAPLPRPCLHLHSHPRLPVAPLPRPCLHLHPHPHLPVPPRPGPCLQPHPRLLVAPLPRPCLHLHLHLHPHPRLGPAQGPGLGLQRQPCRPASSTAGTGWYESVTDSAPVHLTEQLLVSVHQSMGLPWWATIICTTLALRTLVTLPLGAYQMVIIAKVEALQGEIAELAKRLHYEVSMRAREKGWTERDCRYQFKKNLKRIVSELYVRDNCHPVKASLLVLVQLPMWVCLSLALRNLSLGMSEAYTGLQLELAAGGALWFSDLTQPDSTWLMPVSLGLVNLLITEMFALRRLEASKFQKFVTNFIRGVSLVMIPIAATVPSSMAVYWLSSSCVGLGHNLLLRSPRFRRLCRLPASRLDSDTPYRDIAAAAAAKYLKW